MEKKLGAGICQELDSCIPGCKCPTGQFEEQDQCVPEEQCYCYDKFGNPVAENYPVKIHGICEMWWVFRSNTVSHLSLKKVFDSYNLDFREYE